MAYATQPQKPHMDTMDKSDLHNLHQTQIIYCAKISTQGMVPSSINGTLMVRDLRPQYSHGYSQSA